MSKYSPRQLSAHECEELGITFPSVQMDNGEYRFRLADNSGGWSYILTKMPADRSGWQNSHHHQDFTETIIVQKGWIGYATTDVSGKLALEVHKEGDIFSSRQGQAHNVFMPA